jgi:predicted AAA+ superfamily ATPase
MKRCYENVVLNHFQDSKQMAFVCGPRQVGKTTIAKQLMHSSSQSSYKNWDIPEDRLKITSPSYKSILEDLVLSPATHPLLILDEIHKYSDWKNYVKGLYDSYQNDMNILITGSARLNIFKKSGDSLMGRYFLYRIHPISAAETEERSLSLLSKPFHIPNEKINQLLEFGGFPEPFTKCNKQFLNKWQNLRHQQLIYEDIRSLEAILNISQLDLLATILTSYAGNLVNYTNLASKVRVSVPTIQRWISVLDQSYYCYFITPWSTNVPRSLLKEPKVYLWDWSLVKDMGQRCENFIASHLLKAIHFWSDTGLGHFDLRFIRTKDQEEVDFLVEKDHAPWMLIEVKSSSKTPLSKSLKKYKDELKCPIAFQVVFDLEGNDRMNDWLLSEIIEKGEHDRPVIIPVSSFLSMLV